nr:hypothetical protein [Tanacetum cinerariifolium]
MLPVLAVDQMSVPFLHRTLVIGVLAPMETMLYLLHRYCTLPPEKTCCSLPPEETGCSLHPEETSCSLPSKETSCFLLFGEISCSLPPEKTSCFLPPEETCCSLPPEDTSCSLPPDETSYFLPPEETLLLMVRPELFGSSGVIWLVRSWLVSAEVVGLDWRWFVSIREIGVDWRCECSSESIDWTDFFQQSFKIFFDFRLTFLMAKKDRHTYVYQLKDTELETLIATYDIPLDLRPHLPGPNFRMINLPAGDTSIVMGIYDFLCMPSLDKVTVREEPHRLDTSILDRVVDRTTSPALAAGDEVEQADDGTLDDDDQRGGSDFAMEGIESLNDASQDKKVEPYGELSRGVRRATRANFQVSHGISEDVSPCDQEVPPAFNVHDSPPYSKDDWEEIHGVNLGLRKKELYKDLKVCRTALDRFSIPDETRRLRELSSVELSDRMSVLQCQLITHRSMLNARYDHSLRNLDRLTKRCSQQTHIIKKKNADIKQQSESIDRTNEEVSRLTAQLGVLKSRCQTAKQKLSSWDKKHMKYRNERDTLAMEKLKIKEELVGTKSQLEHRSDEFNRAFAGVLNMEISVGVECGLRMDRTNEEFWELSLRVDGFIPNSKEKFNRAVVAFPDTTFPFLDKLSQNSHSSLQDTARLEPDWVMPSYYTSSATTSLRANTHF